MARPSTITGIDIGTDSIKILIVQEEPEKEPEIIFQSKEGISGIRKGVVVDVDLVSNNLQSALQKVREALGFVPESVYVNVDGCHLFSLPAKGAIAVSRADGRISEEDVNRVIQSAQNISLPLNKEVFDVFPKEFIIDGERTRDAVGLKGIRLEADALALGGFSPYLNNLTNSVLGADIQILDRIPSPIAAAKSVLTDKQKELGSAVLDIGAGTSGLAVFEEGDLVHLVIIPIGANNITNDIAIGLKIDVETAERIKIEYGSCLAGGIKKEKIKLSDGETIIFSQKELNKIIIARTLEILREVQKELKNIGKDKLLPGGIIITGGGAKLAGMCDLAKKELKLSCKIGKSKLFCNLEDEYCFSTVCGLVSQGLSSQNRVEYRQPVLENIGRNIGDKIKKVLKNFIP